MTASTLPPEPVWLRRHADVVSAALDHETFSSAVSRHLNVPNGMDGAEHTRYRAVVEKFMSPERSAELEPLCRAVALELLAQTPDGVPVDVVGGFGRSFAVRAQSRWLGWPAELEAPLLQWMQDNHAATRSGDLARTTVIAERFDAIITDLVNARRMGRVGGRSVPVDPTDELAHDFVGDAPLLLTEIVSILRNWTAGDLGTISRCVGSIVNYLAQHPELQEEMRDRIDDEPFVDAAIDEMLRIDNPFLSNRRIATRDVELGGVDIREGQLVYLDWVSANRDPAVFGDPDAFRPEENAANNVVYGIGRHVCPGRALSTMELRSAITEMLAATTLIEPAPGLENVRETHPLAGFRSLHVVLHKR
ncbi:cytochrome P450 [Arthrobacter stackebrandtii]|uniref:Cytochrome P450 n=1 Tax=Arthrobacter stackebrandtii TaxID=272161 RepID=A0ABS4YZV4_9MICC|nr:cytochrome P450 [Arthrobacter stackebrandtii]MBP2414337.1 cytochrome P450 [Arthrobacter stackebrandtii]PYH01483.1 cytochrome P450 [Arthrobacter stackebrandtii]